MITLDDVISAVYSTLLNPWLTIPLAVGVGYTAPDTPQLTPLLTPIALWILAGVVLRFNAWLTRRALNNGVSDTYDWDREIVVVTGGAGGIGGEIVQRLATKGTKVAVLDVLPLSYASSEKIKYIKCDLTNADSLHAAAEAIRTSWGDPTVLCAVAGIVRGKSLLEADKRDLDLTFGVNTISLAMSYKEFVPAMARNNHGHIVTIASATAHLPACKMADYAASKSAALALHAGLQTELKHLYHAPGVRCSVVATSVVTTKMFTGLQSPSQFMMPALSAGEVADAVTAALWAGEARQIEIPWSSWALMKSVRMLPVWWRVWVQDGAAGAMRAFGGRKVMD